MVSSRVLKDRDNILEVARLVSTRPGMPKLGDAGRSLRDLTGQRGSVANKLIKTGVLLIACPDPVTGAIGAPMILAGATMRRRSAANLKEVHDRLRETLNSLASESFCF